MDRVIAAINCFLSRSLRQTGSWVIHCVSIVSLLGRAPFLFSAFHHSGATQCQAAGSSFNLSWPHVNQSNLPSLMSKHWSHSKSSDREQDLSQILYTEIKKIKVFVRLHTQGCSPINKLLHRRQGSGLHCLFCGYHQCVLLIYIKWNCLQLRQKM